MIINEEGLKELMRSVIMEFIPISSSHQTIVPEVVLLTQREAIKLLSISATTIIEWKKKGEIPYKKIGNRVYYDKDAVLAAGSKHEKYGPKRRK
ncbi:MAG: DNA-binding protein [Sphingobacteriales bacterium]|nr:MAG: DNA-binding protein [Sphingobacteriales bacterium]